MQKCKNANAKMQMQISSFSSKSMPIGAIIDAQGRPIDPSIQRTRVFSALSATTGRAVAVNKINGPIFLPTTTPVWEPTPGYEKEGGVF